MSCDADKNRPCTAELFNIFGRITEKFPKWPLKRKTAQEKTLKYSRPPRWLGSRFIPWQDFSHILLIDALDRNVPLPQDWKMHYCWTKCTTKWSRSFLCKRQCRRETFAVASNMIDIASHSIRKSSLRNVRQQQQHFAVLKKVGYQLIDPTHQLNYHQLMQRSMIGTWIPESNECSSDEKSRLWVD